MSKRPAGDIDYGGKVSRQDTGANGYAEDARAGAQRSGRDWADSKYPRILYKDGEPLLGLADYYKQGGDDAYVQVKARQIWGDLVYTVDSDVVAVLMHLGFYAHYLSAPPPSVVEVRALLKLLPPQESYPSKSRFVKSRAWSTRSEGCSFKVEKCMMITKSGSTIHLAPCVDEVPAPLATVQPQATDRQITTRNTGAKGKMSQEVSVQFNLCNEPWLRYTLAAIADKGLKPSQWTSARLHDEVMYLETSSERYQISFAQTVSGEHGMHKEKYTFARCTAPLPLSLLQKTGVPMPAELVEEVETGVEWEELKWGVSTLHVRSREYQLKRLQFMPISKPSDACS